METLFILEQPGNQHCSPVKPRRAAQFESSPSRDFRGISCRSFQSGAGILPTPLKACTPPVTKQPCYFSSKTPSRCPNSQSDNCKDTGTNTRSSERSAPIPINGKALGKDIGFSDEICTGSFSFSELWAGPTYSNSPPPSSLPIPRFSVRPKRTVSLELPSSSPEVKMHPVAKSAPASPTRNHHPFPRDIFCGADSATKTLRRILNLDIDNE